MAATSTLQLLGESALVFCSCDELGEVGVVERVGLAHVAAGVELVEPDLARLACLSRRTAPRSSRPRR